MNFNEFKTEIMNFLSQNNKESESITVRKGYHISEGLSIAGKKVDLVDMYSRYLRSMDLQHVLNMCL